MKNKLQWVVCTEYYGINVLAYQTNEEQALTTKTSWAYSASLYVLSI